MSTYLCKEHYDEGVDSCYSCGEVCPICENTKLRKRLLAAVAMLREADVGETCRWCVPYIAAPHWRHGKDCKIRKFLKDHRLKPLGE